MPEASVVNEWRRTLVRGGPDARHPSIAVINMFWETVVRAKEDRTCWGDFHAFSAGGAPACDESPMMVTFTEVLKKMEHLFGLGHGRYTHRAAAAFAGEQHRARRGARPVGSLERG